MLNPIVKRTRDILRTTPDTVCLERARLVTEAYQTWEDKPAPIRRAGALAHILGNMSLDLATNPILAGNTSSRPHAWMLLPEYRLGMDAQVALENPAVAGILDKYLPDGFMESFWKGRRYWRALCNPGHLAVDLEAVVHRGLAALIAEATRHAGRGSPAERHYRQGMRLALQAVIDWSARYAKAAEQAARSEADPDVRACHERVARACRRVPAQPARDLFEGLQAMTLTHLAIAIEGHGMSISIGSPDRVLAPFIGPDFDPAEAVQWIAAFMLKLTANSFLGSGYLSQAITVGGADRAGNDACNALTMCFLEACDQLRVGDPPLFLRWHAALNPRVKAQALAMLARGVSMPLLVNDNPTVQGFINAGIPAEEAWNYCVIGCNELAIPGVIAESAWSTSGTLLYPQLLNQVLEQDKSFSSMEEVLAALERRIYETASQSSQDWETTRQSMAAQVPTPLTSALMRGCIAKGQDLLVGMAYHNPGYYERGFTNAANALAALDTVVFQPPGGEGAISRLPLADLQDALRSGFPNESLRHRLRAAPKWGDDDPRADRWGLALLARRERALDRVDRELNHRPHMICHVVRSLHHVDGARIAATPDGRLAGAPLADSIGAETGTARAGPTATLNSVSQIDSAKFYKGGYNLNLTLPATSPGHIASLVEGFFSKGGQELQINCLEPGTLRAAQAHPELYPDLLVRVAGLSARFIDLPQLEQDELIHRAETAG